MKEVETEYPETKADNGCPDKSSTCFYFHGLFVRKNDT
jgi:hypothetical protein